MYKETISKVFKNLYSNPKIVFIKRFKKGIVNKTYLVKLKNPNKELVLRIYKEEWKTKKEQYIYELLSKKTDVPVPKVFYVDKSKEIINKPYLILSKVEGKSLKEFINNDNIIIEAGRCLAKIHKIKFPQFGWIIGNKIKPPFDKWDEFLFYDLTHKLKNIKKVYPLTQEFIKKIKSYFLKNKGLIKINSKPVLLHKDYHFSHIFVKDNNISGIIDVEWAIAGHNELDITKSLLWMFNRNKRLEQLFLTGYKQIGAISKKFYDRRKFYEFLIMLSSMEFSCKFGNEALYLEALKEVKKIIENL